MHEARSFPGGIIASLSIHTIKTRDYDIGIFVADIKPKKKKMNEVEFTFYWDEAGNWENKNYTVETKNDSGLSFH